MKMISCFVREQKRYSKNQLRNMFSYDEYGIENFIKTLKAYGILKTVKNSVEQLELSDLLEEDIEIADEKAENDAYLYVFNYVGIVIIGSRIIKSYPKYLLNMNNKNENPLQEMKQIVKVLEKYNNSEEQIINMYFNNGEVRNFNILAIILYLLKDYYEYGVYSNSEQIIEVNGEGPILWDRTINEGFAMFQHNKPFYIETYTARTIDNEEDYFKKLHECILTECSTQLQNCHLEDLFDIEPVLLTDTQIDEFGDKEYILDRLLKEINIQFNTRRQILLKTLYAYIANDGKLLEDSNSMSMFGTTAFNLVWEKVCSEVFDNKLHTQIGKLHMNSPLKNQYNKKTKLIDIIDKPMWECQDIIKKSKDTLIPDLVAIEQKENLDYFIILDAKYYNLQLEKNKKLRGNPGISDITKQYLYQLSYKQFIQDHNIAVIKNCFLLPTDNDEIINKGKVSLKMMKELELEDIQVRLLPAKRMYSLYLSNKHGDLFSLML